MVGRPKSSQIGELAVGYWESRDDITRNWAVDATFKPGRPAAEMTTLRGQWERAVERSESWEAAGQAT